MGRHLDDLGVHVNKCCRIGVESGTWGPALIITIVSQNHDVTVANIIGPRRKHEYVLARACAADLMRDSHMTLRAIGDCLGGRHYSTVKHLIEVIAAEATGGVK